jgi:formylglycine-generating enzyme required for sulfatase activity
MKNLIIKSGSIFLFLLFLSSCKLNWISIDGLDSQGTTAPVDTISLRVKSPAKKSGLTDTPVITVSGEISNSDVVRLYSDSTCTSVLGSGTATGSSIDLTTTSLALGNTTIYASVGEKCHFANVTYYRDQCPTGYEETPDFSATTYSLDPFCIMKYEAKAWKDNNSNSIIDPGEVNTFGCSTDADCGGDGSFSSVSGPGLDNWAGVPNSAGTTWTGDDWKPVSISNFSPWREISISGALNRCRSLGSNYDLVSNYEFMAIARDIESVASNTIGGCLKQGNAGATTCGSYDSAVDPDSGTVGVRNSRAEFELSNGNVLLDFAGNVLEWVTLNKDGPYNFLDSANCGTGWEEPNDLDTAVAGGCTLVSDEHYKPASAIDSSNGTGQIIIKNLELGYFKRGGHWSQGGTGGKGGLYSLTIRNDTNYSWPNVGFRCVYRP